MHLPVKALETVKWQAVPQQYSNMEILKTSNFKLPFFQFLGKVTIIYSYSFSFALFEKPHAMQQICK